MSIVTLQLGQFGNQLGYEFFNTVLDDIYCFHGKNTLRKKLAATNKYNYEDAAFESFFYATSDLPLARAVMIDTEAKVVDDVFTKAKMSKLWSYDPKCCIRKKRGSGNNWALGYCMDGDQVLLEEIMDSVQRQVEYCDRFSGFLLLMSLAGGTGSGLGTRCTEELRDRYPNSQIINEVVWPYSNGEVIVQDYNTILTLSHLYKASTGLIILENDKLHEICTRLLKIKNVGFHHINRVIAHKLAGVLLPSTCLQNQHSKRNDYAGINIFGEIGEHLCSHTDYKLLNIIDIPQIPDHSFDYTNYNWHGLLKHLHQMLIANAFMEESKYTHIELAKLSSGLPVHSDVMVNKSIANMLVIRGTEIDKADIGAFRDSRLYVNWMPNSSGLATRVNSRPYNKYEKSAFLLSNSQFCIPTINNVTEKAWNMFANRAYIHQYISNGISEDDFIDSFATAEQIITNYNKL
ncbi:uncharacterized protein TRIADDRAFT_28772 [Trichoplax adhaerens]|uniref:Tubulin delta chain n=1 Tax=Trichoplax adhaerens TaxID=10228 RepID=B3S4D4_TRIAD|nr:hypothetical protein TRIADDRAFT_28772 [Trichoplax adhaerens]EDV22441.1 hypothetical protein TRIADDRAFT_28772 [Trichoplax adhaerens]|eukprot:XP_002114985.1 hypothetical protein TRIADDRAFT_28772 [Trichoplax adhaerens]